MAQQASNPFCRPRSEATLLTRRHSFDQCAALGNVGHQHGFDFPPLRDMSRLVPEHFEQVGRRDLGCIHLHLLQLGIHLCRTLRPGLRSSGHACEGAHAGSCRSHRICSAMASTTLAAHSCCCGGSTATGAGTSGPAPSWRGTTHVTTSNHPLARSWSRGAARVAFRIALALPGFADHFGHLVPFCPPILNPVP